MPSGTFSIGSLRVKVANFLKTQVPVPFVIGLTVVFLTPSILPYFLNRGAPKTPPPESLGIEQLVRGVKAELYQLEKERIGANEAALFQVKTFDLEISFTVRASSQAKGGIEYSVVTAESQIQRDQERVQKLTLHMETIGEQKVPAQLTDFPSDRELRDVRPVGPAALRKGEPR